MNSSAKMCEFANGTTRVFPLHDETAKRVIREESD